jgi:hypothetical protein
MATVYHYSGTAISTLLPGQSQGWIFWGYNVVDYVNVCAQGWLAGNERPGEQLILTVENPRWEVDVHDMRFLFTVRNVGTSIVTAYHLNFAFIAK